jgi:hypothetical protein
MTRFIANIDSVVASETITPFARDLAGPSSNHPIQVNVFQWPSVIHLEPFAIECVD